MLVGAFTQTYDFAILVSGDADYIPVIQEVQRRGCTVVLASGKEGMSDDLVRAADQYFELDADLPTAPREQMLRPIILKHYGLT